MSNAHASKQHGLTTMNTTRPKSLLRRRNNKHRSVARKQAIIDQRRLGVTAKTTTVKIDTAAPAAVKAPAKKVAAKTAVKKPSAPRKPRAKK